MAIVPVHATEWHYLGDYGDKHSPGYISFYDPSSVKQVGVAAASVIVRSVLEMSLNAYWEKHGDDPDIIDAAAVRVSNSDYPDYFGLATVVKKFSAWFKLG